MTTLPFSWQKIIIQWYEFEFYFMADPKLQCKSLIERQSSGTCPHIFHSGGRQFYGG